MCFFFFFSHFSFFILFTYSLHTLWPRYLQTCIKGSCISFLSTFLQNYSWNSKIPSKSAASAEKKCKQQWQNGGILNWYSPRKKKHFYQQFPGYASTVRKSVMHFQAIWKLEFQFFFLRYLPLGIPHGGISFTF